MIFARRLFVSCAIALLVSSCGRVHPAGVTGHVGQHSEVPVSPGPTPSPGGGAPVGGTIPGISVFFTNTYDSQSSGKTGPEVLSINQSVSAASPNNPDRELTALIDGTQAGGTLDGAFFDIEVPDVVEALVRARSRGVSVRLVTEHDYYVNSKGAVRPPVQKLLSAGITVRPDDRQGLMHDKFLVANGRTVWTGSYNITTGGSYHDNNNAMRLESSELASIYEAEFQKMNNGNFGPDGHPVSRSVQIGSANITPYFSPNRAAAGGPKGAILSELTAARRSIRFMAYAFFDDEMGQLMAQKAAVGVSVSGVFERTEASAAGAQNHRLAGLEGVDVRLDNNPALMHHKVIIVDDSTLIMGSFNFSKNAQQSNNENMLVIKNAAGLITAYDGEFRRIMATSTPAKESDARKKGRG